MHIGVKYLGWNRAGRTSHPASRISRVLVVVSSMLITGCSTPCKEFVAGLTAPYKLTLVTAVDSITYELTGLWGVHICKSHGTFQQLGFPTIPEPELPSTPPPEKPGTTPSDSIVHSYTLTHGGVHDGTVRKGR